MAYRLSCPCGEVLHGRNEHDLVSAAQTHLGTAHPGRSYEPEEIMVMAVEIPDRLLPRDS